MRRTVSLVLAMSMALTVMVPAAAVADQPAPDGDIPIEDSPSDATTPAPDIVVTYPDEVDDGGSDAQTGDPDAAPTDDAPTDDPDADNHTFSTAGVTPPGTRPTASACEPAPASRFPDRTLVDAHTLSIDCVAWWNVTTGLADGTFDPAGTVTRGQLSTFMTNAILATGGQLPRPGSGFPDTTETVHRRAIERLAAAGIVGGFPDGQFRPTQPVTRGQMATFLVGALEHLAIIPPTLATEAPDPSFLDVPGSTHEDRIVLASSAGIAGGFDDGTYRPGDDVSRGQMATFLARLLATTTDAGTQVRAAREAVDRTAMREQVCRFGPTDVERAQPLLDGRYEFLPHRSVTLGTDLTWAENPLNDNNWQFQLHTLRWLWPLMGAWATTGERHYLDRAYAMARSWVEQNPLDDPPSRYSWDDHSAAWRAMVLGCLSMHGEVPTWLADSIATHQRLLADPGFYVNDGNHALNQDAGLLSLACLSDSWDTRDLAGERIARLANTSIDPQGLSNEQSPEYQDYNYERYLAALHLSDACGVPTPSWADRMERMPVALAHMVQPDGTYVTIGDTDRRRAKFAFEHPAMRWMSTGGDSGEPPEETFVTYDAGFTLARSGWGTDRARLDENFLSVRHGEPRAFHGHLDHGAITLFAQGQPLIVDPGKYAYGNTAQRSHVVSQEAHSLITIGDDCAPPDDQRSEVIRVASDEHIDRLTVRVATCAGTGWTRTIGFVRDTGEVVVVDEVAAPSSQRVTQRWQLEPGALTELIDPSLTFASWDSGVTLIVEQLQSIASRTSVTGRNSPLRGWVSERYGELTPAANLEFFAPSTTARSFVTVLRPGAAGNAPRSELERTSTQTRVSLTTADGEVLDIVLPRTLP